MLPLLLALTHNVPLARSSIELVAAANLTIEALPIGYYYNWAVVLRGRDVNLARLYAACYRRLLQAENERTRYGAY